MSFYVTLVFKKGKKDVGNYKVSLISVPGKVREQLILKTIYEHMKDKQMIGSIQHRFMKGKQWLTAQIYEGKTVFNQPESLLQWVD